MLDGVFVCAVHPSYQLAFSLKHQLTSHLVNIIGAVTANITRFKQNFHNMDNVKCETSTHLEYKTGARTTGKVR